ncbi:Maf-like protein [soil metagenome]
MNRIILASQSPRRKQLLEWAEIDFDVMVKETDEHFPKDIAAEEAAVYIAKNKALAVQQIVPEKIILAADTIVVLDDEVIGKPVSDKHAFDILSSLSGKTHRVITGVCILHEQKEVSFFDITKVTFHYLSADQINFYIHKYQPFDKAGAYAIQEWIGVVGIKNISGDFYNVMGLPVSKVVKALKDF